MAGWVGGRKKKRRMADPAWCEGDWQHKVSGSPTGPGAWTTDVRSNLVLCQADGPIISLHARAAVEDDWLNLQVGYGRPCSAPQALVYQALMSSIL